MGGPEALGRRLVSARETILSRVGERLGVGEKAARRAAAEARIAARRQTAPIPQIAQLGGAERVDRFIAAAEHVQTQVRRLPNRDALPAAVADALRERNLPSVVRTGSDPMFDGLDWGAVELSRGVGRRDEPVTMSRARFGVAETGTLTLLSGPDNPVTLTFLGETHFVVLKTSEIEAGFEDVWRRLREEGHDPRTVNFVTGPSRTGDIELKIELGAHGPIALQIFLIDGD